MESRDRAARAVAETEAPDPRSSSRTTIRLLAGCLLLTVLAFVQSAGYGVADTRFDLVGDPLSFLGRAMHLWDGTAAMGQVPNQAYGYLWPMGPFFALGWGLYLPGWVIQWLWTALLLCVGFVGTAKVARALGVRSDAACVVAGIAFATSPRILSTIGPMSIEAWPSAVAPWVLLPLVHGASTGSPRRMAMWAGLAVAMVGGVNAAATVAVLPVGIIWLLTRTAGPRRRQLMAWWPLFTLLGTAWWLVPLFVLGAHRPPYLDYVQTASVTTFPATLFDALRGTSDWMPYVDGSWRSGHELVTTPYLALAGATVMTLGLVGLMLRENPHRQFLVLSVLTGLLLVTLGHVGSVQGWLAEPLHSALDAALAPVRNMHRFDPVIRLPMALGPAWLVEAAVRTVTSVEIGRRLPLSFRSSRSLAVGLVGLLGLVVLGAALPMVSGGLAPEGTVAETPVYWKQTVAWLDDHADGATALVAPGSPTPDYRWGQPRDEPVQYLDQRQWAMRSAAPRTPPGNLRMLDAFETRLARGDGSPGLAAYLRRAGVHYLVIRNDLTPSSDVPDPVLVHQALAGSPGIDLTRTFGPAVGDGASQVGDDGRVVVDGGWHDDYPAVEIYEVRNPQPAATTDRPPLVVGGPEDLLDLADLGLVGSQPTRLAVDLGPDEQPGGAPVILTDGLGERERSFGRVHDGYSAVLTPGDVRRSGNPTPDYLLEPGRRWLTTSRLLGAAAVSASTSRSDSDALGGSRPGDLPLAAVDGARDSEWVSGATGRAWWRVDLAEPLPLDSVTVTLGRTGAARAELRVVTEAGTQPPVRLTAGDTTTFALDASDTSWVRVEGAGTGGRLALAEVSLPGVQVRRPLVTPVLPEAWPAPDAIVLRTLGDARTGCVRVQDRTPCLQGRDVAPEEPAGFDRVVTLPDAASYTPRLGVRPRVGADLFALIQRDQPLQATGSSVGVADARASGLAAIDGDLGTSWTPSLEDPAPELALNWLGSHRLSGITVAVDDDAPVKRPTRVRLTWPGGERTVPLDQSGHGGFRPIRTDRLVIQPLETDDATSVTPQGRDEVLPVGIGEVSLEGLPLGPVVLPRGMQEYPCGSGPTLEVGATTVRTALTASPASLYRMRPAAAELCGSAEELGPVTLSTGENAVRARPAPAVVADHLLLIRVGAPAFTARTRTAPVTASGAVTRSLEPSAPTVGEGYLALRQNYDPGWMASQGGHDLTPVVLDGWQQGWVYRGDQAVQASYAPDRGYQVGLLAGLVAFVVLLGLSLVPSGRWPGAELPALSGREWGLRVWLGIGLVAGGLLGGWLGLGCAAAGLLVGVSARRRWGVAWLWVVAVPPWVAGLAYVARPWASGGGWAGDLAWPHYLVLVSLGGVAATVAGRRRASS